MEDNPPDRSRRSARLSLLLTIPVLLISLAFAQVTEATPGGISFAQAAVFVVLLVLSAFMSGSETALTAIGTWKLRELKEAGTPASFAYGQLEKNPTRFISTLLIANNVVNIAFTALVTQVSLQLVLARGGGESLAVGLATAFTTIVILVFGEITPKSVAVHHPVAVSRYVIRPVYFLSVVVYPLGIAFTWVTGRFLKLFGLQAKGATLMSPDELRMMLISAEESGVIESQEQEMIRGVIELEETVVREVMTPRVDVVAVREDASLADLQALVTEHGYSRLPVYGESIDDIKGVAYARDLLPYLSSEVDVASALVPEIMRPAQYVPETLSVMSLLRDMRIRKNHLAVVVDEFGGMSGIVTLEDIIEEITGEIYDETDEDEVDDITDLGDGAYRLQGGAHIEHVADALEVDFVEDGDYDTVAGFLIAQLDQIPQPGESLVYDGLRFTVESGDERRVQTVIVQRLVGEEETVAAHGAPEEPEEP